MSRKAQSHELTYDLIKRAFHGEPAAIEEYLLHYDAYINSLVEYETVSAKDKMKKTPDKKCRFLAERRNK